MIRTLLVAAALAALPLGLALAADPQVERHELMEQNGKDAQALGAMAKGTAKFDAATAKSKLDSIAKDTKTFLTQFPKGSETGHKTRAKPEIWTNRAEFDAKGAALIEAASAASAATADGADAFKAAFVKVGQACGACHQTFRAPEK